MQNRFLEKISEQLTNHPQSTSGMSPSVVPSKHVNTEKPVESVVKLTPRRPITKSAEIEAVKKLHYYGSRAVGLLGGFGSLGSDLGHTLSGGHARDVAAKAYLKKNPYLTHKEMNKLVGQSDDDIVAYLKKEVPGDPADFDHPAFQYHREMNKRDASRMLGISTLGTAAWYKYKKDKENRYLQAMQDYN